MNRVAALVLALLGVAAFTVWRRDQLGDWLGSLFLNRGGDDAGGSRGPLDGELWDRRERLPGEPRPAGGSSPPPLASGGGRATRDIILIQRQLRGRFSGLDSAGVYNCRKKRTLGGRQLSGWSQHAWGNAWDVTPRREDHAEFVAFARRLPRVVEVIDNGPGNPVHIGAPKRAGTPPCAASSGVVV